MTSHKVDVLVAGAGVAGVLVATALATNGFSCMLVEPNGIAAEQSGHSHGYLHQGYIYLRAQTKLVNRLKTSRAIWNTHIQAGGTVAPETSSSLIGFSSMNTAYYASQMWANAGLPIVPAGKGPFLDGSPLSSIFRTTEAAYDFPRILAGIIAAYPSLQKVSGRVMRLKNRRSVCTRVDLQVGNHTRSVEARYVVLATGAGNSDILMNTFGYFKAAPQTRTSYMLVLRGPSLPVMSLILPENQYYGMFLVSRQSSEGAVWLISNYLSYLGLQGDRGIPAQTWTRATIKTLETVFPNLSKRSLRVGLYAAPKSELRYDPERLPEDKVVEHFGIDNVSVVWPTKLTFAPYIVNELVGNISDYLKISSDPNNEANMPKWARCDWVESPERWRVTPLFTGSQFIAKMKLDKHLWRHRD